MLTRFNQFANTLYTRGIALVKRVLIYYFDDLIQLPEASPTRPNEFVLAKMGSEWLLPKVTVIRPRSADEATDTLKLLMDSTEFNSRQYYGYFGFFIGADFFLSMNNEKGVALRKKILPYLHPNSIEIDYNKEIYHLFSDLMNSRHKETYDIILHHLLDLFCKSVAGLTLTAQMRNALLEIEAVTETRIPLYFSILPTPLFKLSPTVRKLRSTLEINIKTFLYEQIACLQKQDSEGMLKSNWLVQIIREKYQKTPNQLSSQEIDHIVMDSETRMCFGVILGVTNLAKAMTVMLGYLFENSSNSIKQVNKLNQEVNKFQIQSPYLHAVYLETLRHFMSDFFIARYFSKGIKSFQTAPKSIVMFNFDSAKSYHATDTYPADSFAPERFLNDKGQLNQHATLGRGFFTPFGVGKRPCPGSQLAETVFKNYLCFFARYIKYFDSSTVTFYSATTEFLAREQINQSLRHHFFCSKKHNQLETETIVNLIHEYR